MHCFRAVVREGHSFKLLAELLDHVTKLVCLDITEEGISICTTDSNTTMLVYVNIPQDSFVEYEVTKPLVIGLNTSVLFRTGLKHIKKKDSIELSVIGQAFVLTVRTAELERVSELPIQLIQHRIIKAPEEYEMMETKIPSQQYQRDLKDFMHLGSTIHLSVQSKCISFYIGDARTSLNGTKRIRYGQVEELTEPVLFEDEYDMQLLTRTSKIASLSKQIEVLIRKGYPLQLAIPFLQTGTLQIYLKSRDQIRQDEKGL